MFGILPSQNKSKEPAEAAPSVIPTAFDAATLHPMANLGSPQLEYLDLETNTKQADGLIASRGFFEDLSYGTGAMYLLGLGTGGFFGLSEGLRSTSADMPAKLRTNAILNSITRRGPYLGNLCGCLTLTYNVINGTIDQLRGGVHDDAGSLVAGATTGALWRATKGLRPMLISASLLTGFTAGWCVLKRMVAPGEEDAEVEAITLN